MILTLGFIFQGVKTIDIVVENLGRVNYASKSSNHLNEQRKGLSTVYVLICF